MLELIIYPKTDNPRLVSFSPFCAKSEVFLKLAQVEFKINEFNGDPGKFPNSKLPVIQHNGQIIADSYFIQKYVEKTFNVDLDSHLSTEQSAMGYMIAKVCEDHLYWSIVHERWFIDKNWENLKNQYFGHIPGLIRGFATGMIRKSLKKSALGHGMTRHSDDKVLDFGREAIRKLAVMLGDNPFICGDKVSSYDTSVYGTVQTLMYSDLSPVHQAETKSHENLVAYDQRMFDLVYGS